MADIRTTRGLDRLVNFSDATVAIAITLLILPLVDISGDIQKVPLGDLLHDNLDTIVGFFVTFLVISRFWVVHHRVFEYVQAYSPRLVTANFLWLLSIVFLPFVANVLSQSPGRPGVSELYIGTMIVTAIASTWIDITLRHDPSLIRPEVRGLLRLAPAVTSVCLFAAALVLAAVFPVLSLYPLLLLLLSRPILAIHEARRNRTSS
ncbi:TMEM175 family protein [soil metagenome]